MEQSECPVSILSRHPEVESYALEFIHNEWLDGCTLFGTDPSQWDCIWYDLVLSFCMEKQRIQDCIDKLRKSLSLSPNV